MVRVNGIDSEKADNTGMRIRKQSKCIALKKVYPEKGGTKGRLPPLLVEFKKFQETTESKAKWSKRDLNEGDQKKERSPLNAFNVQITVNPIKTPRGAKASQKV